jgi:hypothetical protein
MWEYETMSDSENENTPTIWANLNLPQILLGPAGAALSRLVGKATDIPAAKLGAHAQKIKDDTAARTTVTKAIAEAVAKQAVKDPAVMDRALESFVAKEFRKQENKEAVAKKTAELLAEERTPDLTPAEPEADWMNVFEVHAENASTERMREMWARVLTGEIRKPKSFSLKTLGFIAQLDQEVAATFERHASKVMVGMIPTKQGLQGQVLVDLLQLEEFGLITGVGGNLRKTLTIYPAQVGILIDFGGAQLLVKRKPSLDPAEIKLPIHCVLLTRVGNEVFKILEPKFDISIAREVIELFPKPDQLAEIRCFDRHTRQEGELLWECHKPPEPESSPSKTKSE